MKNNSIKIATLFALALTQAHSMDGQTQDPFQGQGIASFSSRINANIKLVKVHLEKFADFQKTQQDVREKVLELKIIRGYADQALQPQNPTQPSIMPTKTFMEIENWVSKEAYGMHLPGYRILSVPLEFLATTLNMHLSKHTSAKELMDYIQSTKQKLTETERYYTLRQFGQTTLQISHPELEQLHNWVVDQSKVVAPIETEFTPLSFKGDINYIMDAFGHKAGRCIRSEFEIFEANEIKMKSRVQLKKDLEQYFQTNMLMLPPTLTSSYVSVNITRQNCMMPEMALPDDFDLSMAFAQAVDISPK